MKTRIFAFLSGILLPFAATAAREGTPVYYQNQTANQANYADYQNQGYSQYVGQSGQKQVVGSRNYSYQIEQPKVPTTFGTMTPNGIAMPQTDNAGWSVEAGYTRRFADFTFETGVNSILEWDDMVFNEIGVGAQYGFSVRDFDLFAYGKYSMGFLSHGGMSMDYDLKPYDSSNPNNGIFTISMGDLSGKTNHLRLGLGARHVWDVAGWKLSPSIGYEIFKHNLEMSNHIYPNPGVYLPLMTSTGEYVFGDAQGNYYTVPVGSNAPDDLYQVCMSPGDIKVVTGIDGSGNLTLGDYNPSMGEIPWGVDDGECIIIGGDGMVLVPGTTHIYNTTWSGIYFGLEIEKQMTLTDKLRFYVQFGLPSYSSEGIWPNRTDWQQSPSFIDEGSNGAYSYRAEMEYNFRVSDRLQLALKVDTDYFRVGKIGGELYVAGYSAYLIGEDGQYVEDENGNPILENVAAHTEYISDSLKSATWQSFGLHLGVKYSF